MFKKFFYFITIFLFYLLMYQAPASAINKCHLYINDVKEASIDIPFYFYENTKYDDPSSFPITKYKSTYTYIDNVEKCKNIEKQIILSSSYSIVYDYKSFTSNSENTLLYNTSKLNKEGLLKGYATIEDRLAPTINGYKDLYITNIDNPISLSTILLGITAMDETDGNITDKIQIIYDNYTPNITTIGTYTIILSVSDNLNNKSSATINIELQDTAPPLIDGESSYISYLSSPLNTSQIKANLIVSDNYYKNLEAELYICEDNYTQNKDRPGIYNLFFCVYDLSNNYSTPFKIDIEVKDDISPTIDGLSYYTSYLSSPLTIKEITYSLIALDNNKDITDRIYILEDYYSNYQNAPGEKSLFLQVKDDFNNPSSPFKITINLVDDIKPQIFGLNTFTSYMSHPLTTSYIKQQLVAIDNIDNDISSSIEIIEDSYTNNINKTGTYYLTFQVKDSSDNISDSLIVSITNIDDVAPYIKGPSSLIYELKDKPTIQQILMDKYKAIDNVDSYTPIEIISDDYSSSLSTGEYYVELVSTDSSSNKSIIFQIKITIVENIIQINNSFLYLPSTQQFSIDEINNLINFEKNFTIKQNDYSPNFSKDGSYLIEYELEDTSIIKINIKVYTPKVEIQKKETFLDKVKSFFQNIINYIKSIFAKIILPNIYLKKFQ